MDILPVDFADLTIEDLAWMRPLAGMEHDWKTVLWNVSTRQWKVWRLGPPATGVAITFPKSGNLFIYYLRGSGLFGSLSREDLMRCVAREGLAKMSAQVDTKRMLRVLATVGFEVVHHEAPTDVEPEWWELELV